MSAVRRRALIALALMVSAFGAAQAWKPRVHLADQRPKVDLETVFPREFAGWRIDTNVPVQLISPDTEALLNRIYHQTLSRTYVNAQGQRVMLSVAYGGDQSDATRAHRPEVCYPAQGFQVLSMKDDVIQAAPKLELPVRRIATRLGARSEPVTYWIVVGERVALSGTQQKLAQLSYSTRGIIPDGMLVRVSNIEQDAPAGYRLHESFIVDLATALQPEGMARIFGRPGATGST